MSVSAAAGHEKQPPAVPSSPSTPLELIESPAPAAANLGRAAIFPESERKVMIEFESMHLLADPDENGLCELRPLGSSALKCALLADLHSRRDRGYPIANLAVFEAVDEETIFHNKLEFVDIEKIGARSQATEVCPNDIVHFEKPAEHGEAKAHQIRVGDILTFGLAYDEARDPDRIAA